MKETNLQIEKFSRLLSNCFLEKVHVLYIKDFCVRKNHFWRLKIYLKTEAIQFIQNTFQVIVAQIQNTEKNFFQFPSITKSKF